MSSRFYNKCERGLSLEEGSMDSAKFPAWRKVRDFVLSCAFAQRKDSNTMVQSSEKVN